MLSRIFFPALFLLSSAVGAGPVAAQTIAVQNGATVQVSGGAVLDLEGGTMDFGTAGSTAHLAETSAGRVTGGTLTATRALNAPSQADPAGLGAAISASEDLGEVAVTRGHAVQDAPNGNEGIARYYDISPSQNNSGLSATLTHAYVDAELNGLSESNLELFKSTDGGDTWSEEGFDSRDGAANTVTLSGIESFSRWTLGSEASPLPVELASFEATKAEASGAGEEAIKLTWTTASEQNNAGFEVQRRISDASAPGARRAEGSSPGGSWKEVGYRESKAPGGTADEAQTYRFTDGDLPYAADTLAYRLRQVDVSGAAQTTDPVRVARSGVSSLQLKETYPNPARAQVMVRYAVPDSRRDGAQEATLRLYDVLGREVRTVRTAAEAGRHETQLSVGDLASGVYVLRLEAGPEAETRRLTVVR